jgi:CBS domain protein
MRVDFCGWWLSGSSNAIGRPTKPADLLCPRNHGAGADRDIEAIPSEMMILEIGSETVTRTAVVFSERSQANRRGRYRPLQCELTAAGQIRAGARRSMMNASKVMTRKVISVWRDASIWDAIRQMLDHGISGLPVVDVDSKSLASWQRTIGCGASRQEPNASGRAGSNCCSGQAGLADEYVRTHGRKVGEIMTEDVVSVAEDTPR